jgi:hypothetical protein
MGNDSMAKSDLIVSWIISFFLEKFLAGSDAATLIYAF